MHWHAYEPWGWMWWMWPFMLVIIGGIIGFAVWAARRDGGRPREETPEQIVKRRYAKGEIDRETYQRLLDELRA